MSAGGAALAFPYGYAMWLTFLPMTLLAKLLGAPTLYAYGLTIFAADLGLLIDHGAYMEENGFWFKKKPNWLGAAEYSYEDLQGSDTFDLNSVIKNTGTFVVLENIDVNRIKKVGEHNKFSLGGIMNYLTQK